MAGVKAVWDTPEQIRDCLHCPFVECIDCLGRGKTPWELLERKKRRDESRKSTSVNFLTSYISCTTDEELAQITGKKLSTVYEYRRRLGLPKPGEVTVETKKILVEACMKKKQ